MVMPLEVLVSVRESSERYRARLLDTSEVHYTFCETDADVAQSIEHADVILGSIAFPAECLDRARQLRWIQVTAAGVDRFLERVRLPDHVVLTRADVAFGDQIAEYVLGHLLALTQRVRDVHHLQRTRTWCPLSVGFLNGRTMGIAGTGSIGRTVARRARGFGMRIVGLATAARDLDGFERVFGPEDKAQFLSQLDVLVLCLPLTERTRGFIGAAEIDSMKRTAVIVNVARGAVIDEKALIDALRRKRIRAAILDVFEHEPLPPEHTLWELENATVTSHHAGLNVPDEIIDFFLENLRRFCAGEPLCGSVDVGRGY